MTLYKGKIYSQDDVSLREPNIDLINEINKINFTELDWIKWRKLAQKDNSVYYFAIYYKDELVGEIFLHDINQKTKEALLGYHLFNPDYRGKGIGTLALGLLQKIVKNEMNLSKLIIITGIDNVPSKKIAEKCNFKYVSPSWEDPKKVVY
ncbi:MAG: GNAT family N-acetyltransferase, partial [Candidatus Daviesbacteria bacterium]|nr:GNAT family N-acetyltransferase [Candidatus Daviesbacteria bacterium]